MQDKKTMKLYNLAGPGGGGNVRNHASDFPDTSSDGGGVKGLFQRFEEELKNSIFNVMYLLLRDSDISVTKLSILLFIEFLQML